ncbi:terminase small subunit-like protein [Novosphingobium naphthalenivorans]|uniref:terminase small subunit-like protein n=1 Tax=Novosphingobium naphthalenivorans TaxID=273168 RepID=UPI00157B8B5C|nr:terminase small subunit protein [Novosphingobium naphthalenivorans]
MDQNAPARPRAKTPAARAKLQRAICERIMLGESVRAICDDMSMPARSTVMNWLRDDPEFRTAYALAKQLQADMLADEIIDIADDGRNDWVERKREDGSTQVVFDHENVQRSKLRVDSRKWLAAKLAPKRYGDAQTVSVGVTDGEGNAMSLEETVMRLAAIAAGVAARKGGN